MLYVSDESLNSTPENETKQNPKDRISPTSSAWIVSLSTPLPLGVPLIINKVGMTVSVLQIFLES